MTLFPQLKKSLILFSQAKENIVLFSQGNKIYNFVPQLNSFGAIGDYSSRPLVDRYCRLWSKLRHAMTSLRLQLSDVSILVN